jgi:DNA mismatch endonuclease (patch repair protein)
MQELRTISGLTGQRTKQVDMRNRTGSTGSSKLPLRKGRLSKADKDRAHRSWTMSRVKSKNTVPEIVVRRAAHELGLRFRLHRGDLPGKPDLVFPRWRVAIFVNGCFWHSHEGCNRARLPRSNSAYWKGKLLRNVERDHESFQSLRRAGWRVIVIWECESKRPAQLKAKLRRVVHAN